MSTPRAAGVLDTSVFIATESGRQLDEALIPDEVATTVVTLADFTPACWLRRLPTTGPDASRHWIRLRTWRRCQLTMTRPERGRGCGSIWPRRGGGCGSTICGSLRSRHRVDCPSSPTTTTSLPSKAPLTWRSFESDPGNDRRQTRRRDGVLWQCSRRSTANQLSGIIVA